MPINLSIKNVPETVAEALRTRAAHNHRSLQGELMAILEHAVMGAAQAAAERTGVTHGAPARSAPRLSIDEVAARAATLFPKGTSSSADFIRAMRDGRYGQEWAQSGRQGEPE